MKCRRGKSIIFYAIIYFYLQKRLPNCKHSRRKRRIGSRSVNYQKEHSICTNPNSCRQPTRTEAKKVIFSIAEFHYRMEVWNGSYYQCHQQCWICSCPGEEWKLVLYGNLVPSQYFVSYCLFNLLLSLSVPNRCNFAILLRRRKRREISN